MTDLHGDMGRCPRCGSDKATQLKRIDSVAVDYHVDIFRCKCGAYLVSSCCWDEHSPLTAFDSIGAAYGYAEECIRAQEAAAPEEGKVERKGISCRRRFLSNIPGRGWLCSIDYTAAPPEKCRACKRREPESPFYSFPYKFFTE